MSWSEWDYGTYADDRVGFECISLCIAFGDVYGDIKGTEGEQRVRYGVIVTGVEMYCVTLSPKKQEFVELV